MIIWLGMIKFVVAAVLLYLPEMEEVGWGVLVSIFAGVFVAPGMCWGTGFLHLAQ